MAETSHPQLDLIGRYDDSVVKVEVIDNGPGIIKEALEHIFVPFYTTKRTGSGIVTANHANAPWIHYRGIPARSADNLYPSFLNHG